MSAEILVVLGPTASGKTRLGVALARRFGGEILSADSRQVYRGLDLGAGKDLSEYVAGGAAVRHHLIDIADLEREYSVFHFQQDGLRALADCRSRGVLPVIVGGTGLYLESLLFGYALTPAPENPALRRELEGWTLEALADRLRGLRGRIHNSSDLVQRDRLIRAIEIAEQARQAPPAAPAAPAPGSRTLILGLAWEPGALRQRIRERLRSRIDAGLIEEVRGLQERGVSWDRLHRLGLEYRFVAAHLQGKPADPDVLEEQLFLAICDFAKRQRSWFRRMERRGAVIHWIAPEREAEAFNLAAEALKTRE